MYIHPTLSCKKMEIVFTQPSHPQVDSYKTRLLKGNPFLASYGLQDPQQAAKAGTYKAPSLLKVL